TVDTTAPLVAINAVTTRTNNSKPSFSGGYGVASGDNAAVTVTVYRGAGTGGTVVATPTATLDTVAHTWSTAALASALSPDGSYTVAARQTDTAGNTGAATSTFLLDTAPPTVAVSTTTNPVNSTNRTATSASGTTETGATVSVVATDGAGHSSSAVIATVTSTTWSATGIDVSGLNDGTITYTATATDAAGNTATAAKTATKDTVVPTVTVNQASAQADPTKTSPINFTVVFSKSVTGFTASGVTLGGTAGGTKTIIVTGSDSTYNVAVSGMTDGTVTASVSAAAASDGAGNANTASTSIDNSVTYDTTPPTASAITTA